MGKEDLNNQPVLDYLKKQFEVLKNDYRTPDGHVQSCTLIACDVARLLIEEEKIPSIYKVLGKLKDGSKYNRETLIPRLYEGRVEWGGHIVTVDEENVVYDPMLGKSMSIDNYKQQAFLNNDIEMVENISSENVPEFISR